VDAIGSSETFMGESEGASVDPLGALASLNWKSLGCLCSVIVGCLFRNMVGS
jgi:hypothetical protein